MMTELEKMEIFKQKGWTANFETGEIFTSKGKVCKNNDKGYILCNTSINKKVVKTRAHRLIWFLKYGKLPNGVLDHINKVKNDNRISNLRDVSIRENLHNVDRRHRTSNYTGVHWIRHKNKCRASIWIGNKRIHLGYFTDEVSASEAYQKKLSELYGKEKN